MQRERHPARVVLVRAAGASGGFMTIVPALSADSRSVATHADVRAPHVAVVVGCYNQAPYVEAAIRSVAAQTYRDLECVVVDDASTDDSARRIESALLALGDSRFRAVTRDSNGGQMATMLQGFDATAGAFVSFLDGDDVWLPNFLEQHVLAHTSSAGVAAVSAANLGVIDRDGVRLAGSKPNFIQSDPRTAAIRYEHRVETVDGHLRTFVARCLPMTWLWSATSGLMFRRSVLETIRPARPERLRICADFYLARAAHMVGGTVRMEQTLGHYRLHGANAFSRNLLLGDRSELGKTAPEIVAAANDEVAGHILGDAGVWQSVLPADYLGTLLLHAVGYDRFRALAAENPSVRVMMKKLPRPVWRQAAFRRFKARFGPLKRWLLRR